MESAAIELEGWWHSAIEEWRKNSTTQNTTVLFPQPAAAAITGEDTTAQAKSQIADVPTVMLQPQHLYKNRHALATVAKPIRRVLIAEPEEDIQMLYRHCLEEQGLELTIVSTGVKCLESVFNAMDSEGFDIIILDTHLKDILGIEIARRIKQRLPDQRIIITSTTACADDIERLGINKDAILKKPFRFSKLLGLIKTEK
jgi:CheY-like chemotaxis protein